MRRKNLPLGAIIGIAVGGVAVVAVVVMAVLVRAHRKRSDAQANFSLRQMHGDEMSPTAYTRF